MEKQDSKKDSDLPLNHYITVNFSYYFNLVFTTHVTRPPCCAQMKAQTSEPVNIAYLPKICLNKSMHTGTDFDTTEFEVEEIEIYTNTTVNVKTTVSLHNTYYG